MDREEEKRERSKVRNGRRSEYVARLEAVQLT